MRSLFAVIVFFFMVSGQDRKVKVDESFSPNTLSEPEIKWPVILRPGDELPEELKERQLIPLKKGTGFRYCQLWITSRWPTYALNFYLCSMMKSM